MTISTMRKAVLGFLGLVAAGVLSGYIVERIKGTPPDQIAAAMWHPFGAAIGGTAAWLHAPAQVTHSHLLLWLLALVGLILVLLRQEIRLYRLESTAVRGPMGKLVKLITEMQGLDRKVVEGSAGGKPAGAPEEDPKVPEDFEPTTRQAAAATILQENFPTRCDVQDIYTGMVMTRNHTLSPHRAVTKAEIASDLEALAAANIVKIEPLGENYAYYHLTKPGRAWVNARGSRRAR